MKYSDISVIDADKVDQLAPTHPNMRIANALAFAFQYGNIDGAHHRKWTIDQMVRCLTGSSYAEMIKDCKNGEDGPETYEWDEGIPP
jgi:hypothetical protein